MKCTPSILPEVKLIEPVVHVDERGSFQETYHEERYRAAGIPLRFVQHNQSWSERHVLRGLHAQMRHPQGKLMRVVWGRIFDVAVDLRAGSPTFLRWTAAELSAEDARQFWIPPGFAHGFCVLSERACVEYKCTDFYSPGDELRIRWDDPRIGIRWPIESPLLSPQDRDAGSVDDALRRLAAVREPEARRCVAGV